MKRRTVISALCLGLVFAAACRGRKDRDLPQGPTRAAAVAQYRAQVQPKLESYAEVVRLALAQPALSLDELSGLLEAKVATRGVVLNDGADERTGNARLLRLELLCCTTSKAIDPLGLKYEYRRLQTLGLPRLPTNFLLDVHAPHLFSNAAVLLGPELERPERPISATDAGDLEELTRLKYVVVLRTAGFVAPQLQSATYDRNVYSAGLYAAQAMLFDLDQRRLLDQFAVVVKNEEGGTTTGPDFDLSYAVEKQVRELLGAP